MELVISLFATYISSLIGLWIIVMLFSPNMPGKITKVAVLAAIVSLAGLLSVLLGSLGALLSLVINLIAITSILKYDFLSAFLTLIGLSIIQYLIMFGMVG